MTKAHRILRRYREKHQISCGDFAKRLGIAEPTLRSLENGTRPITAERAKEIEDATEGAISRHELRPDLYDQPVGEGARP